MTGQGRRAVSRLALVGIVVLMGGALLLTVWTTYAGVRDASAILVRGQADALQQAVRAGLAELDGPPADADLADLLAEQHDAGLRYIAVIQPPMQVIATAGAPEGGPPVVAPRFERGLGPQVIDGRLRVQFRTFRRGALRDARENGPPPGRGGRGYVVIVELEPQQARQLRQAAARTLGIGGLAGTTLLAVALVLGRMVLRREALERQRERDRRLASLGELSAVLAHEIRNPLASLKGNAQLLAAGLPEGERARQKADRVVDEAVRLETLTNDLLDFVRTGEIRRVASDPAALLRDAAASVDPDIDVDADRAPPRLALDAERLRQVLVNLLDNAVQAGPPVRAAVFEERGRLIFEVRDGGPGIAPEDLERIFEPFFTRRTRGTGLGLAVARRVVELHGGTITAGNAAGGGALFRVSLPAVRSS